MSKDLLSENAKPGVSLLDLMKGIKTYSHRNDETEPPTQFGWYWFWEDEGPKSADMFGTLFLPEDNEEEACDTGGQKYLLSSLHGRWWGPVTPAWKKSV